MDWKEIESAPKDGSEVIVFADGELFFVRWACFYGRRYAWHTGFSCADEGPACVDAPTHWMPAPSLPHVLANVKGERAP